VNNIFKYSTIEKVFLVFGSLVPSFFVLSVAFSVIINPDYNQIEHTVSILASDLIKYPFIVITGIIVYGLGVLPLGWMLYKTFFQSKIMLLVAFSTILYGLSSILAAIFKTASTKEIFNGITESSMHDFFALLVLIGITFSMLLTGAYLIKINYAKTFSTFSIIMVCITIIFAVIFDINSYPEIRGLIQRVVFISTLSWVQVAYFRMLLQK
tara:strand:+ start:3439 stop:4071 length:633 start_codon:yes stop_codon:yes gene_type:complete